VPLLAYPANIATHEQTHVATGRLQWEWMSVRGIEPAVRGPLRPGQETSEFLHQRCLPLMGQHVDADAAERFAHPAEQEVARVFSFFRLRWAYEPTSFTLRRHADGSIAEMFTPDFFLPDLDLYVELTTMRQPLVTRKNRKARLLRELYPNVRLRLLYRRDYVRLMECYRGEIERSNGTDVLRVVQTEDAIQAAVDRIAMQMLARTQRGPYRPETSPVIVTVNRSSRQFAEAIIERFRGAGVIARSVEIDLLHVPSTSPRIRATRSNLTMLRRAPVFLVDTLVSTGLSLGYAQRWLAERGAAPVATVALFARASARIAGVQLDSVGFMAPNDVLVGFGLQLRSGLAGLPYVAAARTSGILPPSSVSETLQPESPGRSLEAP
jgi:hypoxanthine-guanine phosphoribosyltransferase